MRVFLSWSGPVSKEVAFALREWLPHVIQAIDPWMSTEDIEKGSRWASEIASQLKGTKAGIVCITPDNQTAPWLNFEAGALSKTVDKEMVCPYLFRMKLSDLTGPLVQFQTTEATKEDTLRLIETLNKGMNPKPLSDSRLADAFGVWWKRLESRLSEIAPSVQAAPSRRPSQDMLEELLALARDQARTSQSVAASVQQLASETAWNKTYIPGFTPLPLAPAYIDGSGPSEYPNLKALASLYAGSGSTLLTATPAPSVAVGQPTEEEIAFDSDEDGQGLSRNGNS